jgi:hypothetical protein
VFSQPVSALDGNSAVTFVIPTEAYRISCYLAPTMAACAAFFKESRMKFANATKLDRKSGVA